MARNIRNDLKVQTIPNLPANTRLQRTPLRVERDRAFFSAGFCYTVAAIYRGGAAKAQPVGWLITTIALSLCQML